MTSGSAALGVLKPASIALAACGLAASIGLQARDIWRGERWPDARQASMAAILNPATTAKALAGQEASLRRAVDKAPLDSSAYALLGLARDRDGKHSDAERLMAAASGLNHRDTVADVWLLGDLAGAHRYDEAFSHADALLRRKYGEADQLGPLVFATLKNPDAIAALGRTLAGPPIPPWRAEFLSAATRHVKEPDGSVAIFNAIVRAGGSIDAGELSPILVQFVERKRFDQAYLLWLLASPKAVLAKAGPLIASDFADTRSAYPFTWSAQSGRFLIADASAYGRQGSALRIAYQDVGPAPDLGQQLLMLTPGAYRLQGDGLTVEPGGAGRSEWAIVCASDDADIASAVTPQTHGQWRRFSFAFTVPAGCPAQWIRARAVPVGDGALVETWYSALSIHPMARSR